MSSEITFEINDWIVEVKDIYRIDDATRKKLSKYDYAPRIVSFGPYYYGHSSCITTQCMKENVLSNFLKESNMSLDDCMLALKDNVQDLKRKYVEADQQNDDNFLRLMILDGCFLLEVVREVCNSLKAERLHGTYDYDNPVWDKGQRCFKEMRIDFKEMRIDYINDVLLPENQIPIMVLYKLRGIAIGDSWEAIKQVNNYIHRLPSPLPRALKKFRLGTEYILDLYRDSLRFGGYMQAIRLKSTISNFSSAYSKTASNIEFLCNILSAKQLKEARIEFTTSKNMGLMDVSFTGGILRLPKIFVDSLTRSIFLNVIVYEKVSVQREEVTSYVYFMSKLLRDVDDVKLLLSRGIIHSNLSHDEIIKVFHSLTNEDIMRDPEIFLVSNYMVMVRKLRKRYDKMSNEWRRDLWQNYLRSPFAIVSVIAAFLLFSLSAIQTVYAVLGYYNPK